MKNFLTKTIAIFIILVFALSLVGTAFAKNDKIAKPDFFTVSGKAKIKGKMTEGIKVSILDGDNVLATAMSNSKGIYTIKNVEKGKYHIMAEYEGYKPKYKNLNIKNRKKSTVNRNFNLNKKLAVEPTFSAPECNGDLDLKIDIEKFRNWNNGDFDSNIYAGDDTFDSDEAIPLVRDGEFIVDNEMDINVPGLALKRFEGYFEIYLKGNHANEKYMNKNGQKMKRGTGKEHVQAFAELDNGEFTDFANSVGISALEKQGDGIFKMNPGQDEVFFESGKDSVEFAMTVTVKDDAFYLAYECNEVEEPEEVPEEDTTAPVVTLDNHDELITTSSYTFTGTVDDETADVKVNAQDADVSGNTWSIELSLEEGSNEITVTSQDEAGNEAESVESIIIVDTTAPVITLYIHEEGINSSTYTFTGTVDDETADVFVNGEKAEVNGNDWTIELELEEEMNSITVTAEDEAGNQAEPVESQIYVDTIAPDTFIDDVQVNGEDVDAQYHGTESVYSYKIDDGEWSDWTDSHFAEFTGLEPGEHTLFVRSMDDYGNIDPTPAVYTFTIEEPEATIVVLNDELDSLQIHGNTPFYNSGYLTVNRALTGRVWSGMMIDLIKFDSSVIPADADIKSATLVLTHFLYNAGGIATTDEWQYNIKEITEYWEEDSIGMYTDIDGAIRATVSGTINDDVEVQVDLTELVTEWVNGESINNGIWIEVDERFGTDGDGLVNNVLIGRGDNNPQAPNQDLIPKIVVEYY